MTDIIITLSKDDDLSPIVGDAVTAMMDVVLDGCKELSERDTKAVAFTAVANLTALFIASAADTDDAKKQELAKHMVSVVHILKELK